MWLAPTEETAINVINGHEYTVINSLRSNVLAGLQLWVISYIHSRSVYTALYEGDSHSSRSFPLSSGYTYMTSRMDLST